MLQSWSEAPPANQSTIGFSIFLEEMNAFVRKVMITSTGKNISIDEWHIVAITEEQILKIQIMLVHFFLD